MTSFFVGSLPDASVTGDLEATGRSNAGTDFQPSPARTMVTGRERLPPKQPSSHDDICDTIDNWEQVPNLYNLYFLPYLRIAGLFIWRLNFVLKKKLMLELF